jgi:asparagine synthase (glutamine-hydrolysing)
MCGILGIIGKNTKNYTDEKINSALNVLSKRGPDDRGVEKFDKCILGQTRLSIIDLSSGHQPMKDNQKDVAITFNGEIYNYNELKEGLEKEGHSFSTNSDTEVILKSYIEYGVKCLDHFEGMFAFAIWDNERKKLFMARDRFGKKPFYYTTDKNNNFIFASEIKAILELGIKGDIDYKAIDDYLRLLYIPQNKSIYKNILNLPPAHFGIYKNGKFKKEKYWELKHSTLSITRDEAKKKLEELLEKAVLKRLVADVEVGTMLSGGLDSSLVSAIAQKNTNHQIKTFSVGFENFINELPFAKSVSEHIKSDHNELSMNVNIAEVLKEMASYYDEPHADAANLPTYLISKMAKEKMKVLLSGDGADELFYGYGWTWRHHNLDTKKRIWQLLFSNPFNDYLKATTCFNKKERKNLWKNKGNTNKELQTDFTNKRKVSFMEKINLFDLNSYLPGDLLTKLDRASMMASLEVRSPFLDRELVEFSFNLPEKFKADNNGTGKFKTLWGGKWESKILLKEVAEKYLPFDIVYRRKQGFGPPIKPWMEKENMRNLIRELFIDNKAGIYDFLKEEEAKILVNEFYKTGKKPYQIWVLTCLELWHKNNKKYFK